MAIILIICIIIFTSVFEELVKWASLYLKCLDFWNEEKDFLIWCVRLPGAKERKFSNEYIKAFFFFLSLIESLLITPLRRQKQIQLQFWCPFFPCPSITTVNSGNSHFVDQSRGSSRLYLEGLVATKKTRFAFSSTIGLFNFIFLALMLNQSPSMAKVCACQLLILRELESTKAYAFPRVGEGQWGTKHFTVFYILPS